MSNIYASDNPCDEKIIGWAPPSHEGAIFALQLKITDSIWLETRNCIDLKWLQLKIQALGKIEKSVSGLLDICEILGIS